MDPARDFQLEKDSQKLPNFLQRIELSVKEDKYSTRTLSLVIRRVRFKKNLPKSTLAFKGGVILRKPSILMVSWVSSCPSFFLSTSTADTYIFTALTCTTTVISLEPCALNAELQQKWFFLWTSYSIIRTIVLFETKPPKSSDNFVRTSCSRQW